MPFFCLFVLKDINTSFSFCLCYYILLYALVVIHYILFTNYKVKIYILKFNNLIELNSLILFKTSLYIILLKIKLELQ